MNWRDVRHMGLTCYSCKLWFYVTLSFMVTVMFTSSCAFSPEFGKRGPCECLCVTQDSDDDRFGPRKNEADAPPPNVRIEVE